MLIKRNDSLYECVWEYNRPEKIGIRFFFHMHDQGIETITKAFGSGVAHLKQQGI